MKLLSKKHNSFVNSILIKKQGRISLVFIILSTILQSHQFFDQRRVH